MRTDHDSGRRLFGPDSELYYTIGDQGHNQFDLKCLLNHAQELPTAEQVVASDWSLCQGKLLRLNLDGSIPTDNPSLAGVQSHIYTNGHRNAQGLAFAPDGTLYETEHGPKTDDELNVLVAGGNYGWPDVAGFQDDLAYVYANWSAAPDCETLEFSDLVIPGSVPQQEESAWSDPAFVAPEQSFFVVADDYDFEDPACAENGLYYLCWPTIAPSSLAVYSGATIPDMDGKLLITSLKLGTLYEVDPATEAMVPLYQSTDRFRRVTVSADGGTLYVATDSAGNMLGADGSPTSTLDHPGAILALEWVPDVR